MMWQSNTGEVTVHLMRYADDVVCGLPSIMAETEEYTQILHTLMANAWYDNGKYHGLPLEICITSAHHIHIQYKQT